MAVLAVPLPRGWTKTVRSAVVQAIAVAATALTAAWGRAATAGSTKKRLLARIDRAETEIALLNEELDIKNRQWSRLSPRRRPHYGPIQRMRILQLKAARGWSREQTAKRFLVTEETVASWTRRVDEEGQPALVQIGEPVNRLPDFVAYLVRWLKVHCPGLGKVRIAQMLARAGLHLGATTVKRMLKRELSKADVVAVPIVEERQTQGRVVTAKYPNHVWHVDLTTVPTRFGFWVPWVPFSLIQR